MNFVIKTLLFLTLPIFLRAENTEILNLAETPVSATVTIDGKALVIEIAPESSSGRFQLGQGRVKIGDLSGQGEKEGETILVFMDGETPSLTSYEVATPGEKFLRLAVLNLTAEPLVLEIVGEEKTAEFGKITPLGDFKKVPRLSIPGLDQRRLPRLKTPEKSAVTLLLYKNGDQLQFHKITVYGS